MYTKKTPIYLMPGMAANPSIFDNIKLSDELFDVYTLSWFVPAKEMSIEAYALKMTESIKEDDVVLIGVSFGGILVQEMAKHIKVKKLIIISSVKSKYELPKKMLFAKYTHIHKLLPTGLVNNMELLAKYAFGETITKRVALYERFLSVRDKNYIDWAIHQIVNWQQKEPLPGIVHIHGDKDNVFPIANIKNCIVVEKGSHIMIINKFKWLNEQLPRIILD